MAGLIVIAAPSAEIALVTATKKGVLQITAPTNHRLKILRWGVAFDGVSVTGEPVQVHLARTSTAGTFTALSLFKNDPGADETIQSTAGYDASANPTESDLLFPVEVHPQASFHEVLPMGQEYIVPGGGRVCIFCTAPAGVNVKPVIVFEE